MREECSIYAGVYDIQNCERSYVFPETGSEVHETTKSQRQCTYSDGWNEKKQITGENIKFTDSSAIEVLSEIQGQATQAIEKTKKG